MRKLTLIFIMIFVTAFLVIAVVNSLKREDPVTPWAKWPQSMDDIKTPPDLYGKG